MALEFARFWSQFDEAIDACYADELGRLGMNTRLVVGLLYLKHAFDESDESMVARWAENLYWQFFCGLCYMQHELPIDPSSSSRFGIHFRRQICAISESHLRNTDCERCPQ